MSYQHILLVTDLLSDADIVATKSQTHRRKPSRLQVIRPTHRQGHHGRVWL